MKSSITTALLASTILLTGCTKSDSSADSVTDSVTKTAENLAEQGQEIVNDQVAAIEESALHTGAFSGRNDHVVTGTVTIVQAGDKQFLILDPTFSLDNAPDPKIGFGTDDTYDTATTFTPLEKKTGAQRYEIPSSIDPSEYNQVYIWCEEFSVALGVAPIN